MLTDKVPVPEIFRDFVKAFLEEYVAGKCSFYEETEFHNRMGCMFARATSSTKYRQEKSLEAASPGGRLPLACPICPHVMKMPCELKRHMCEHFKVTEEQAYFDLHPNNNLFWF